MKEKQNVRVTIEEAENGVTCTVCYGIDGDYEDKKYIYKDIKEVVKALPAIFSVGEAEAPQENESSMEKMKDKLSEGYGS